ncbi:MAG: MerR family transcriptional regulator, partial [Acidimicrobiales bacterium]
MSGRSYLSIGDVLSLLREEFPDVTISKIRFLESQGLVDPERSPSGYRKFYDGDVARLRWVLRKQRDQFLPLKVIRDRLAAAAGGVPPDDEPVSNGEPGWRGGGTQSVSSGAHEAMRGVAGSVDREREVVRSQSPVVATRAASSGADVHGRTRALPGAGAPLAATAVAERDLHDARRDRARRDDTARDDARHRDATSDDARHRDAKGDDAADADAAEAGAAGAGGAAEDARREEGTSSPRATSGAGSHPGSHAGSHPGSSPARAPQGV